MPDIERDEKGRSTAKLTPDIVLDVIRDHPEPVVTINDVVHGLEADGIDVVKETARKRVMALEDAGKVERKEVGARAVVWWSVDD